MWNHFLHLPGCTSIKPCYWYQLYSNTVVMCLSFIFSCRVFLNSNIHLNRQPLCACWSVRAVTDVPAARLRRLSSTCAGRRSSRRRRQSRFFRRWRRDAAERRAECSSLNLFDPADPSKHTHTHTFSVNYLIHHFLQILYLVSLCACMHPSMHNPRESCMDTYCTLSSTCGYKQSVLMVWNELLSRGV